LDLTSGGHTRGVRRGQDKGHRAIWQAFLACLRAGGPAPIPYEQLFGGARAALAAVRSLETGQEIQL